MPAAHGSETIFRPRYRQVPANQDRLFGQSAGPVEYPRPAWHQPLFRSAEIGVESGSALNHFHSICVGQFREATSQTVRTSSNTAASIRDEKSLQHWLLSATLPSRAIRDLRRGASRRLCTTARELETQSEFALVAGWKIRADPALRSAVFQFARYSPESSRHCCRATRQTSVAVAD